jgi:tetratricopeptide (TPR) repeat protein
MKAAAIALAWLLVAATPVVAAPAQAGTARELYARAEELRFAEDWYGAIESYLAALEKNPSYGEALAGLAECYYGVGEYDEALSYVRKAIPLRAGDAALADLEGFILVGLGDLSAARARFEGVRARAPNDLDARFGLAVLDLAAGKKTEARARLEDSLRLSPQNARALLSLALLAQDQGKKEEAAVLVEKALRYHGGEPRTQYVAARVAAASGDAAGAAFHARAALDQKPSYADARLLLASLMYESSSYEEAISLMREAVARDRKDGMAWYTLGVSQAAAGKAADAAYSLRTATSLRPDDEVARIALENLVMDTSPVEDSSRESYAEWHFKRGTELEARSLYDQALFEYRRGLRIYPYSTRGRVLYAGLLKARGYPGKYLSELRFLKANGRASRDTLDAIEIYESLLADDLGHSWSIDEGALPKRPYSVALVYESASGLRVSEGLHAGADDILLRYIKDLLTSSSRLGIVAKVAPRASSFAEAFRSAREAEADYFGIVAVKETERDIAIGLDLRVARTGSPATTLDAYRSGNDRVKNTASRIVELLASSLAPSGSLLKRSQDRALVDLGKEDGIAVGDKLVVLKKGSLDVKPEGLGYSYSSEAVLGEIEVTRSGEAACEGTLKSAGFFDAINVGDRIVLAPPVQTSPKPAQATPASKDWPGIFNLVRRLR